MNLFADYLQPLTNWVYANPNWAFLITFLISFSESLAIIGSIVPGSLTMTAIGILAGSGVMRIDLTFLAAVLGAIAGDGASYALGYILRNRLINIWPFSRYPNWLSYGKKYFAKHGGKSVLIGRFVGPLRSIIPVIAGMMHMNRWHFFIANVLSAIGWSFLYVVPGILIGVASSELSAESASRLFVVILISLAVIWLLGLGLRWLFIQAQRLLQPNLHRFWLWLQKKPFLLLILRIITPPHETNHYATAALAILFLLSLIVSIIITGLVIQGTWIATINQYIYLFLQSVRTESFDVFFIIIRLFINPLSLLALILSILISTIYYRDWRTFRFWLSLVFSCAITLLFLTLFIATPKANYEIKMNLDLFYPAMDLTFATALFGFLIFYISTRYRTLVTLTIRVILLILLFLAGIAAVYLGDNQFTSVMGAYFIGLTLCFIHWIFYRRVNQVQNQSQLPIVFSCLVLAIATGFTYLLYFEKQAHTHRPYLEQYVLTHKAWWHQQQPLLPLYTTNRIGQRTGIFNIQYVGSIDKFQHALESYGWKKKSGSFFYTLLIRAGGQSSGEDLPLMAELYLNRRPSLIMIYNAGKGEPLLILRLWRSNYHLRNYHQPIWLGSIHPQLPSNRNNLNPIQHTRQKPLDSFKYVLPALSNFKFNRMSLPEERLKAIPHNISPTLLFIKEPTLEKMDVNNP